MGLGTGAAGVAAAAPIFLPIIKIGIYIKKKKKKKKKNENEKKDVKFVFSCNGFLSNSHVSSSLTAIIARRGKGLTVKD